MSELFDHVATEQHSSSESALHSQPISVVHKHLTFTFSPLSSHLIKSIVSINSDIVEQLRQHTIALFKNQYLDGFDNRDLPDKHIEESYNNQIQQMVRDYLFYHHVIDYLFHELNRNRITAANYPRLTQVETSATKDLRFHFDISIADEIELKEWKHFSFKSPKRKKYKDLDKQVISFLEKKPPQGDVLHNVIESGDWVHIEVNLIDKKNVVINKSLASEFWVRVSNQDAAEAFIYQLTGKQLQEQFYTTDLLLYQGDGLDNRPYRFIVTIKTIIKGGVLSVETFKSTYKLKSKQDVHNKLMEIFSYRNDISQRKAIIEEVFHLLLSKHRFEVPKHLILRREELINQMLAGQPDYNVYKTQKDFSEFVQLLAEKQLKEEIIIDQISQSEEIHADIKDIINYLHLLSNKRLKEFIYFKPLISHLEESDFPINMGTLLHTATREKTINQIIHLISK